MNVSNEQKLLLVAIFSFKTSALKLINKLADEYEINFESDNPFSRLVQRKNEIWKGKLSLDWLYQFHGDACKFINIKSGQIVDVKINRGDRFDAITAFYLYEYVKTTKPLQYVLDDIDSVSKVELIIEELKSKNILLNLGDDFFETIVLNEQITNNE